MLCPLLCLLLAALTGCNTKTPTTSNEVSVNSGNSQVEPATTFYEVKVDYEKEVTASYGGMTLTVNAAEDPGIVMENDGRKVLFFNVTVKNATNDITPVSYLNNFTVTVDGTYYEAIDCVSIPSMKKLYDFYGESALNTEIGSDQSCTGYIAMMVDPDAKELQLHYTPKSTDRTSKVTVVIDPSKLEDVSK